MPLSDEERRRLKDLEEQLSGDDPRLARELGEGNPGGGVSRSRVFAVLTFLAGLVLVIAGIATQILVFGVIGFVVECVAAYTFLKNGFPVQFGNANREG